MIIGTGIPLPEPYIDKIKSTTALARSGVALDVAKAVVFMASPLAKWMSGVNLEVDGGFFGDLNF